MRTAHNRPRSASNANRRPMGKCSMLWFAPSDVWQMRQVENTGARCVRLTRWTSHLLLKSYRTRETRLSFPTGRGQTYDQRRVMHLASTLRTFANTTPLPLAASERWRCREARFLRALHAARRTSRRDGVRSRAGAVSAALGERRARCAEDEARTRSGPFGRRIRHCPRRVETHHATEVRKCQRPR